MSTATLDRVTSQYRRDVHQLADGASVEVIAALEERLGRTLPVDLKGFLQTHNGAALFRDSIRIRSASDHSFASSQTDQVVLFADGKGGVLWGWAERGDGQFVYGSYSEDRLEPWYGTFGAWLDAEVAVTEARASTDAERTHTRASAVPNDPFVRLRAAESALGRGDVDTAIRLYSDAAKAWPTDVEAWHALGRALFDRDVRGATRAWTEALRACKLPLPWPGAPLLGGAALRALAEELPPESWERELTAFLDERVADIATAREADMLAEAVRLRADLFQRRGDLESADDVLGTWIEHWDGFRWPHPPWPLLLESARIECVLGRHDAAEGRLGRLRENAPPDLVAEAGLVLLDLIVTRLEPWATDLIEELEGCVLDADQSERLACLRVENELRLGRIEQAERALSALSNRDEPVLPAAKLRRCRLHAALARRQGHAAVALEWLHRGEAVRVKAGSEEALRLSLLSADLAHDGGDTVRALREAADVAEGFHASGHLLREAWALVRCTRWLQPTNAHEAQRIADSARQRFLQGDLPIGVATVDAIQGDHGRSLGWHLERCSDHARARRDARNVRGALQRPDADRPERRLAAHRMAIAACPADVVPTLHGEMKACARAVGAGGGRATDPAALRYVAAADLLAGHPSFEAADVLLGELLDQQIRGNMLKALKGAIARSTNVSVRDGLLRMIEQPGDRVAVAIGGAAEVLGLMREEAAVGPLVELLQQDPPMVAAKAALLALGRIGQRHVADTIRRCLDSRGLSESAAIALLLLGDRRGVDFHGRALTSRNPEVSGSPGELVGRYGGPEYIPLLLNAAAADEEQAVGALQGLGLMGDPRVVPMLIEAIQGGRRAQSEVACGALELITGHVEHLDDAGARSRFQAWWEANLHRFQAGRRYRYGRPHDPGALIARLDHDDEWVRQTAYDELVIATGVRYPFDANGPWRVQRAQLRAWQRWWREERPKWPAGHWWLDGQKVH